MTDGDLRTELTHELWFQYRDDPDTIIVEELGLRHGKTRVDVAVVNGSLHGFELKSDSDTLRRLAVQAGIYSSVLDEATLVVGARHFEKAATLIPNWWGISVAVSEDGVLRLREARSGTANPNPEPLEIAKLLWREEALSLLRGYGAAAGVLSKPRRDVYARLIEELPIDILRDEVRRRLKSRKDWRVGRRHMWSARQILYQWM